MTAHIRIALVGNSLPRRCGIATFTTDIEAALAELGPDIGTSIVALTDPGASYVYPETVGFEIRQDRLEDYVSAAAWINSGGFDAVLLQHEFGIFGGDAGSHILSLLKRLEVPIVTTLHTVLEAPNAGQRHVMERILAISSSVVVMAEKGRDLLQRVYQALPSRIQVIPHGIPDFGFVESDVAKAELGYSDRTVILTFGLLSPNKGIEVMIDAMPAILAERQDAVYVVLGATHPNLVRDEGEAYRDRLVERARGLGIADKVVFVDQFVDRPTLLKYIAMCDVYVTPYLNRAQMTSGTLAYSFGLGKAVVSTPYWHAAELLADGKGVLVPFGDTARTGAEIAALLGDEPRRLAMRHLAYQSSRAMTWDRVARRYADALRHVARRKARPVSAPSARNAGLPVLSLVALSAMTDDTGLFQHAVRAVPDRSHGYCIDDNARALLLVSGLSARDAVVRDRLAQTYAAFVQHGFNPDLGRFRNFLGFDRSWLEPVGSEDSHGRTLWALGQVSHADSSPARRLWAQDLFRAALPQVENFTSPRAWAFTLLGLDALFASGAGDDFALQLRLRLASRLIKLLRQVESDDWVWFEEGLSYENARIPEALIRTGLSTGVTGYVLEGLRTLSWLMARQTSPAGWFRPVGTEGFTDRHMPPRAFDQQPVEAAATIAACLAAFEATRDRRWQLDATRAFAWFTGSNDLGESLVEPATGLCRDGLHPDRVNENCGGESVVSYLLALADMQRLDLLAVARVPLRLLASADRAPTHPPSPQPRGLLVQRHAPAPSGPVSPA
jgi:glycosyltransferase involved in cell wall biosynthesis